MQYFLNASTYLTEALFSFALYIVLLRFWMQWVRADFRNELGQFIISLTNPIVIPLRRIIPSIGTVDTATLVLAYGICLLKLIALYLLAGASGSLAALLPLLLVWAFGVLIQACIYLFMVAIFVSIIASWVAPHSYHPILMVLRSISEPLLAPARKLIPAIGGLDLSPMLVLLLLNVSIQLIVAPILAFRF